MRSHCKNVLVSAPTDAPGLYCTTDVNAIAACTYYIVTVPTPVDKKQSQFNAFIQIEETVGSVLKKGDIVIYESTVYPGVTEEECSCFRTGFRNAIQC
jgi:UDP-N-acetyl-D-galactosamine dehydrogenase